MTDTFKKLNYKAQSPILVLDAPPSFGAELEAMSAEAEILRAPGKGSAYSFALAFAPMKTDLATAAKKLVAATEPGAVLWLAYPKQTSKKYSSDLNRDVCWETVAPLGLQPVRQISIDDNWSALRYKQS
jgi:hypothetical protein